MAQLRPGVLINLLNAMKTGSKPTGEHRSSLLQVTDIVPADLDETTLWPSSGFYIKVADASHSVYARLPFDQDVLILSNQIQLGQFLYVDRLEPGSPLPFLTGAKPIPGRHPVVGTPDPLIGLRRRKEEVGERRSEWKGGVDRKRGSWEIICRNEDGGGDQVPGPVSCSSPKVLKPVPLDFDQCTPAKSKISSTSVRYNPPISPMVPPRSTGKCSGGGVVRASIGGALAKKRGDTTPLPSTVPIKKEFNSSSPSSVGRLSDLVNDDNNRKELGIEESKWFSKVKRKTWDFGMQEKKSAAAPSKSVQPAPCVTAGGNSQQQNLILSSSKKANCQSPLSQSVVVADNSVVLHNGGGSTSTSFFSVNNLPGKLGSLGREALQQSEAAQKIALQALRDATATENVVRCLKLFDDLSKHAKPEAPANTLDKYLEFHSQVVQTVTDMVAIQAATTMTEPNDAFSDNNASDKITHDSNLSDRSHHKGKEPPSPSSITFSKRRLAMYRSVASFPDRTDQKKTATTSPTSGRTLKPRSRRSSQSWLYENDENKKPYLAIVTTDGNSSKSNYLTNMIKLGRQIDTEAGNWFMAFLGKALDMGMKKKKEGSEGGGVGEDGDVKEVSQSVILKVINWIQVEQCDPSKRPVHPKAAQIARKLRIKMKNP